MIRDFGAATRSYYMMPRTLSFFLMLFLIFPAMGLFAQEEDPPEPPQIDIEWFDDAALYSRGDRTFTITLGTIFPTIFWGAVENNDHGLSMGGTGSLAFNFFLSSNVFIGGELAGMFASTRGRNMLYIIPFGFRIGYQFVFRQFEFPISVMVGAAPQMRLEDRHFGLVVKPGASAFWRFNADWSFGINAVWWFLPQWPNAQHGVSHDPAFGNFLTATLSARYHF